MRPLSLPRTGHKANAGIDGALFNGGVGNSWEQWWGVIWDGATPCGIGAGPQGPAPRAPWDERRRGIVVAIAKIEQEHAAEEGGKLEHWL